jgi:ubiquinone/menaquinone biosynthesis C-methylase UbiE
MENPFEGHKNEQPSTYFVQDRRNKEEFTRLTIQDRMITTSMGGVLPEQADPSIFHQVLDVGCGTGGWAIAAAKMYATMSLVGIDISEKMIEYACKRANAEQVAERVSFRVMDALSALEFPPASFDLINLRMGVSFVRTWDWPKLISRFQQVIRPGGVIRLTESDITESNSPAQTRFAQIVYQTLHNAGHTFRLENDGLTSELAPLLRRQGLTNVQTQSHMLTYRAGTAEGDLFVEDAQHLFRTLRPFIQKWMRIPEDYDELYRQALIEMQQADFVATWRFVTAWGTVTTTDWAIETDD